MNSNHRISLSKSGKHNGQACKYQHFLLFPLCFQKPKLPYNYNTLKTQHRIVWQRITCRTRRTNKQTSPMLCDCKTQSCIGIKFYTDAYTSIQGEQKTRFIALMQTLQNGINSARLAHEKPEITIIIIPIYFCYRKNSGNLYTLNFVNVTAIEGWLAFCLCSQLTHIMFFIR